MKFLKTPGTWIFVGQLLLVILIFHKVLLLPSSYYTSNQYDGIKILFTLQSYVEQEGPGAWATYQYMNYPYGEHIIFAGSNPLFSFIIKSLYEAGVISAQWVIPVYFWMILFSIPLTGLFLYLLLIRFTENRWISVVLSITLPWINYQLMRIHVGHFDLAMTCFLLINMYLLFQIALRWDEWKRQLSYWAIHFWMIFLLAFIHLYLAAVAAFFTAVFCLVFGLYNRNKLAIKRNILSSVTGALVSGIAFAIIIILFALTDSVAAERKPIPEGYNWSEWNAQFSSIFTPSHGEKIKFPLLSNSPIRYENDTYLSSFALYGLLALLVGYLFRKRLNLNYERTVIFKNNISTNIVWSFVMASLVLLFVSFGEEFYLLNGEYVLKNYLNLFLLVKKIYPKIQQFRVLARFNFYFFWTANIVIALMLSSVFWKHTWGKIIVIVLLIFSCIDLFDRLGHIREGIRPDNFVHDESVRIPKIDYSKFQAILPIPFYLVGSEDYNMTIDPEDNWNTFTYHLSYKSKLPLMASKMSRSSLPQTYALISLFTEKPDSGLIRQLEQAEKPVLVVYDPALPRVEITSGDRPLAKEVNENFGRFLERESSRLTKVAVHNGLEYYSWKPVSQ